MDQVKIGKFIAAVRKERTLTQRQLGDLLDISDKTVSKWECGNGMPEVSLLMPLCDALEISVNELLSGERLSAAYQEKAEENLVMLFGETETERRGWQKSLWTAITGAVLSILLWLVLFADGNLYQLGDVPTPLTLLYLLLGFAGICTGAIFVRFGILRKCVSVVLAVLSTAAFVSLVIGAVYGREWLILVAAAGMLVNAAISVWNCFHEKAK